MSSTVDAKKLQADESTNKKTDNIVLSELWLYDNEIIHTRDVEELLLHKCRACE